MKSEEISTFLSERIEAGDFPSAVYLIGEKGEIKFADALGSAVETDEIEIAARLDTIYDLASLTKVLVTGLLWAKLIEREKVKLNDAVCRYFPGFNTVEKHHLTLLDLLTHVSGFPAWKPFYFILNDLNQISDVECPKAEILSEIQIEDLQYPPRTVVRYSDFNFLTLVFMLEKLYSSALDEIARYEIIELLKL